ncbi:MAG: hypothetical protein UX47_C0006G0060 [Candidatus Collierbacteria bacterium GW2011_GWA2_46_26]|uniref:Uncharacterized protein n=1 Tax=Candidatus Collierbacteria bacterium GW2011_GWA2_46_26 TaxID=1618381 RepID=A0A0G1PJW9_9BACT|nr:MAG: hypothetical protein UX47_C0006G0060 [Candidatus Collierbacteria bacterium GW2011_GWA2_46_26]
MLPMISQVLGGLALYGLVVWGLVSIVMNKMDGDEPWMRWVVGTFLVVIALALFAFVTFMFFAI